MAERVYVRQNSQLEIEFRAADPHDENGEKMHSVAHLHELTPYGLMLASLGSCTSVILHSCAKNHGLDLDEVEIELAYQRMFEEDCQDCDEIDQYEEQVEEALQLHGDLSEEERDRLFQVSRQCAIYKIMEQGMRIETEYLG
jgi:putative redox protein